MPWLSERTISHLDQELPGLLSKERGHFFKREAQLSSRLLPSQGLWKNWLLPDSLKQSFEMTNFQPSVRTSFLILNKEEKEKIPGKCHYGMD